jgi:spore germination cell wall hydrolase CwlJ-like protein
MNLSESEINCIAKNAYHEARGEPQEGVIGVIAVTINRMLHPKFPLNACDVVYQKRNSVCQFSWHCANVKPPKASSLVRFRQLVLEYNYKIHDDPTNGSVFYHTHSVKPTWSRKATPEVILANHIFFKELHK